MTGQSKYIAACYCCLSHDYNGNGVSESIETQVIIYKGGILPPNIYYDCDSFVVNRKAVVGKELKPYINAVNSTQKGAAAIIKHSPALHE